MMINNLKTTAHIAPESLTRYPYGFQVPRLFPLWECG